MLRGVTVGVLAAALTGCADTGWRTRYADGLGYRYKPGCVDVAELREDVLARRGAEVEYRDGYLRVLVADLERVYLFTRDNHEAHPALIVMHAEAEPTRFEGFAGGDLQAFEVWLKAIARDLEGVGGT